MGATVDEDGCNGEENSAQGEEEGDSYGRGLAGGGGSPIASLWHLDFGSGQQECGSKVGGLEFGLTPRFFFKEKKKLQILFKLISSILNISFLPCFLYRIKNIKYILLFWKLLIILNFSKILINSPYKVNRYE